MAIGFNNSLGALICVGICLVPPLAHSALSAGCTDADGEGEGKGKSALDTLVKE